MFVLLCTFVDALYVYKNCLCICSYVRKVPWFLYHCVLLTDLRLQYLLFFDIYQTYHNASRRLFCKISFLTSGSYCCIQVSFSQTIGIVLNQNLLLVVDIASKRLYSIDSNLQWQVFQGTEW